MPDHPVPQGDDIILPDGTKVGSWNGDDVKDLQVEVLRIIKEQKDSGADRNNLLIRFGIPHICLLYTSPSPRDMRRSRMPSSA